MLYYADPNEYTGTDAEKIQSAVSDAVRTGIRKVVIPPYNKTRGENRWVIEKAVELPSDITIVIDNAYMVQADGVFDNMFVNENLRKPEGRFLSGTQRNIVIVGVGNATLDGGNYNGLHEHVSEKDGFPHISRNNMILFSGVDGFAVKNLKVKNQRWWALNFLYCRGGHLADIDFAADFTFVHPDGVRRDTPPEGDYAVKYNSIYIKNADGIDLRAGCHNILIENITGYTEDDSIALTGLCGGTEKLYRVEDATDRDIHDIIIRNIRTKTVCANVRLLNQSGVKLYNILIDGVFDALHDAPYGSVLSNFNTGLTLRIGDPHLYGTRQSTPDETYNITAQNVVLRAPNALSLCGGLSDSAFRDIRCHDGGVCKPNTESATLERVKIENIGD